MIRKVLAQDKTGLILGSLSCVALGESHNFSGSSSEVTRGEHASSQVVLRIQWHHVRKMLSLEPDPVSAHEK